jgi:hypothetical protein
VTATILDITGPIVSVISTWSQRNLERKTTIQLQMTQVIDVETSKVSDLGSVETTAEYEFISMKIKNVKFLIK